MLDADPDSVAEAAAIAAGEVDGVEGDHRVKSEVFDNPIYDQPTLPRRKKNGSVCSSVRTGEVDSKLGSVSSVRSFSASSSHYSPRSLRASERGNPDDTQRHDYEDIKTTFDEMPRLAASFQGSGQFMHQSEKLTVINESYDSLPCSGDNSFSFIPHSRLHASSVPNCTSGDGHRLSGTPIITEVNISEAFSKRKKAGSVPNTQEHHDDLGANSCNFVEIDLETTEQ